MSRARGRPRPRLHLLDDGRDAHAGRALITRRGKPFVVVVGVEGEELLDVMLRWDPAFWQDMERRRVRSRTASVSLEEFEREVSAKRAKPPRRKPTGRQAR